MPDDQRPTFPAEPEIAAPPPSQPGVSPSNQAAQTSPPSSQAPSPVVKPPIPTPAPVQTDAVVSTPPAPPDSQIEGSQPDSKSVMAPWERTRPQASQSQATELNYPDESAPLRHHIGKILSQETPSTSRRKLLFISLSLVLLFFLPISAVLALAYHDWPALVPIPPVIKHQADRLILHSPLPKPPGILFRLIADQLANTPQLQLQALSQTSHPISQTRLEILLSADYDQVNQTGQLRGSIELKTTSQPDWTLSFQAQGTPQTYYTYVAQNRPLPNLDFAPINQTWIEWNVPSSEQYFLSGQQALNQLKQVKLEQLRKQILLTAIQQSEIDYSPEELPDYYVIKTIFQPSQILDYYQRLVQIYQESRLDTQLPDSIIQANLQMLAASIQTPMEVTMLVRQDSYLLENLTLTWQTSPPVEETVQGLRLDKEQYHHKISLQIQPLTTSVSTSPPDISQPAEQFYWPEMIRLSLLQPFLPIEEF